MIKQVYQAPAMEPVLLKPRKIICSSLTDIGSTGEGGDPWDDDDD